MPFSADKVYELARRIPRGKVVTYGDLAWGTDQPRSARHVGWAMSHLPSDDIPWWRVVNGQGRISDHANASLQAALLREEGVYVDEEGRLDLGRHRWSEE